MRNVNTSLKKPGKEAKLLLFNNLFLSYREGQTGNSVEEERSFVCIFLKCI